MYVKHKLHLAWFKDGLHASWTLKVVIY